MKNKNICKTIIALVLLGIGISMLATGCRREKKSAKKQKETAAPTATKAPYGEDIGKIVDALKATSMLPSFTIQTDGDMQIKGKLVQGTFKVNADVAIVNDRDNEKLQMTMESTSDFDDPAKAYYVDGWYYSDDKNGKIKEEKSRDEVLSNVNNITGMVLDNAESIENVQIKTSGATTIYSYEIPAEMAQGYLDMLLDAALESNRELNGAEADLEQLKLETEVNAEGLVVRQKVWADGEIKKSILKVPAEISICAIFAKSDAKELKMPDLSGYEEK